MPTADKCPPRTTGDALPRQQKTSHTFICTPATTTTNVSKWLNNGHSRNHPSKSLEVITLQGAGTPLLRPCIYIPVGIVFPGLKREGVPSPLHTFPSWGSFWARSCLYSRQLCSSTVSYKGRNNNNNSHTWETRYFAPRTGLVLFIVQGAQQQQTKKNNNRAWKTRYFSAVRQVCSTFVFTYHTTRHAPPRPLSPAPRLVPAIIHTTT